MFEFKNGDFVFLCEKEKIPKLNLSKNFNSLNEILDCGIVLDNRIILKNGCCVELDYFSVSDERRTNGYFLDIVYIVRDISSGFNSAFNCLSQYIRYNEDSTKGWTFTVEYKNPNLPKKMTLKQIEEALGYNIILDEN